MNNLGRGFYHLYVSRIGDIYVSGGGNMNFGHLNKSTNDGLNWFQVSDYGFFSLASDKNDVLFGKRSGQYVGVFRSTNHGQDWEYVLPLSNNNGQMYITNSGEVYVSGNNTLYKSTNNGNNWTQENITGLITSILENQNGKLFISTYANGRVYKKDGDSLIDITYNLNGRTIYTMCFNSDGKLLVGTDQGVYISNQSLIGISNINQSIPNKFILYQNYPNPFNPVTLIRYSLSENRFTTLKIFDALGKEVAILLNEKQNAGTYEVNFDGSGLPSGIYFYKLSADDFTDTKRMILLK